MNPETTAPTARPDAPDLRARLEGYFRGAVLLVLLALGAIATLRGYVALDDAIRLWLRPQWVPVAQGAFSLLVIALCVWLIRTWVIRRSDD